jgi:tetratricopeptide (TPR) repeat protein
MQLGVSRLVKNGFQILILLVALVSTPSEGFATDIDDCLVGDAFLATAVTFEACTQVLKSGVSDDTTKAAILAKRGEALYFGRQFPSALADLNESLELSPGQLNTRVRRARLLTRMGEFVSAQEDLALALSMNPKNAPTFVALANLYNAQYERSPKALAAFHMALELDPENALASLSLAKIYFYEQKEREKGLAYIERLLAIGPDKLRKTAFWRGEEWRSELDFYQHARLERAIMLRNLNHVDQAKADLDWVINDNPKARRALLERARLYMDNRADNSRALDDVETAMSVDPYHDDAKLLKLNIFMSTRRTPEALALTNEMLSQGLTPESDMAVREARWRIFNQMGDADQALSEFEKLASKSSMIVMTYQNHLKLWGYYDGPEDGQYSGALRSGIRACIADPDC